MHPIVLLTCDRRTRSGRKPTERTRHHRPEFWIDTSYVQAVVRAGGIPLLVPPEPLDAVALLDRAQAVVLTGGPFDIHPSQYGQQSTGRLDRTDARRTSMECDLASAALARDLPVLGLCGGMQVMAVAAGGTLVQDLPKPPDPRARGIDHEQWNDPTTPSHTVQVTGAGLQWLNVTEQVNSTHHQAVLHPGAGFQVVARAPDGTTEAIAASHHRFAVGVQWHPELLGDDRLYQALVRAARG